MYFNCTIARVFFLVEYLPEDGRKRQKHVGLPHASILSYLIIVRFAGSIYCDLSNDTEHE